MRAAARSSAVAALLLLGACTGNKYDYATQTPAFAVRTDDSVVVAVLDQRPEVLSGDSQPSFVGLQRIALGVPYDVSTESGRPLADDMADMIVRGLAMNDVPVESVGVFASADAAMATEAVLAAGAEKGLIVLLRQWKTDSMFNVDFHYDVMAIVTDNFGYPIATAELVSSPDEQIGGSMLDSIAYASEHVPEASALVLERLINQPNIVAALE